MSDTLPEAPAREKVCRKDVENRSFGAHFEF